ncbi:MAG: hypothetical protein ABIO40_11000 [Devosia sp.]
MKSLPFWFFGVAVLFVLAGMIWGIQMAISQDHTMAPAHAHNNLIGFVTMAIYGIYYRLVPAAADRRLAVVHFWVALVGAVCFPIGLAMALMGQSDILIQIASIVVLLGMAIFVYTVWTNKAGLTNP